jgi:hypothetical protein
MALLMWPPAQAGRIELFVPLPKPEHRGAWMTGEKRSECEKSGFLTVQEGDQRAGKLKTGVKTTVPILGLMVEKGLVI